MTRFTERSWPGIVRAEKRTRSPGSRRRSLCSETLRDLSDGAHASPEHRDATAGAYRRAGGLRYARHVARKRREDDPARRPLESRGETLAGNPFGKSATRPFRVGRVHEGKIDSSRRRLGDGLDVGRLTVGRVGIELEVSGVEELPAACLDQDRRGVRDRVRDPEESDCEVPCPDDLAAPRLDERFRREARFLEAPPGERERERQAVDGRPAPLAQERESADVVFVTVGQEHRVYREVLQWREVRGDPVDSGKGFVGERDADVDDEVRSGRGDPENVAPELAETTEGDERDVGGKVHFACAAAGATSIRSASAR